jgi:hypothetical protein
VELVSVRKANVVLKRFELPCGCIDALTLTLALGNLTAEIICPFSLVLPSAQHHCRSLEIHLVPLLNECNDVSALRPT